MSLELDLSYLHNMQKNRDIPNVIKWLKKHIGVEVIDMLLQTSRVTRIDLTLDVHSKRFLRNYYFSIPNARTGRNFLGTKMIVRTIMLLVLNVLVLTF